jgi:hypothetical protein
VNTSNTAQTEGQSPYPTAAPLEFREVTKRYSNADAAVPGRAAEPRRER